MPVAKLHLIEGYSDDEKLRLGRAVSQAIMSVIPANSEAVTVLLEEHKSSEYMRGGQQRSPAPALPDPKTIVTRYLDAMEQRDLETAKSFLADAFVMHFPNTAPMHDLSDLITWAKSRYQYVKKTYSSIEAFQGDECGVVVVRGLLNGVWPDGSAFENIRFIDRFEVVRDKIRLQDVWNDLGEVRPKT